MQETFEMIIKSNLFKSVIVVLVCFIFYKLIKKLLNKGIRKYRKNMIDSKKENFVKVSLKYIFLFVAILLILQINGINISSLVASFGIISAIVGFALQDALKDMIMGINIVSEKFFVVGDIVKYKDIEGKVISIDLKNTKIRDIRTGDIISITNRNIDQITTLSNIFFLEIPVSYEEDLHRVESVLNETASKIITFDHIHNCEYVGIDDFAASSLLYKIKITCDTEFKPSIKRAALREFKLAFDENSIKIPYPQLDVHMN